MVVCTVSGWRQRTTYIALVVFTRSSSLFVLHCLYSDGTCHTTRRVNRIMADSSFSCLSLFCTRKWGSYSHPSRIGWVSGALSAPYLPRLSLRYPAYNSSSLIHLLEIRDLLNLNDSENSTSVEDVADGIRGHLFRSANTSTQTRKIGISCSLHGDIHGT